MSYVIIAPRGMKGKIRHITSYIDILCPMWYARDKWLHNLLGVAAARNSVRVVKRPKSLHEQLCQLARQENISRNPFITLALAEQITALAPEDHMAERALAKGADVEPWSDLGRCWPIHQPTRADPPGSGSHPGPRSQNWPARLCPRRPRSQRQPLVP